MFQFEATTGAELTYQSYGQNGESPTALAIDPAGGGGLLADTGSALSTVPSQNLNSSLCRRFPVQAKPSRNREASP